jgi:hypothetical protein
MENTEVITDMVSSYLIESIVTISAIALAAYLVTRRPRMALSQEPRREPRQRPTRRDDDYKRRRPSAYNQYMRDAIPRIKTENPGIDHKVAFTLAAQKWSSTKI